MGKIVAVCLSEKKGIQKRDIGAGRLIEHFGLEGDAHAGKWHRQVSLLARESADIMREKGLKIKDGDFGENIVTDGIDLKSLPIGTVLKIGSAVNLRVTQIGKLCHDRCAIYYTAGDCIMPREGIFAEVLTGGSIKAGDEIIALDADKGLIRAAILTLSDKGSRGEREDKSGEVIRTMLAGIKAIITAYEVIPDEKELITKKLFEFAEKADLVVTTGGTGVSPRDVTPEATRAVIEKELPGFAEAMRMEGLKHTPRAMGSRAVAGIYKQTLIINLPGSPKGVAENLAVVLPVIPHTIGLIKGKVSDCAKDREKHA